MFSYIQKQKVTQHLIFLIFLISNQVAKALTLKIF